MEETNEKLSSFIARHESVNYPHHLLLSFHGIWALTCWLLFTIQWIRLKGTHTHIILGKFILFGFLIPLELTGLLLCPYMFLNVKRANILLSAGHLVVPSMGFLFVITTYRAFKSLQNEYLSMIIKYFCIVNILLQVLGSSILCYKIFFGTAQGIEHENNLELFLITTPFSYIEIYFAIKRYKFDHPFYTTYLTLQMLPGSMIVFARDHYWLWNINGLTDARLRILIENAPMIPLYGIIYNYVIKEDLKRKASETEKNHLCNEVTHIIPLKEE